MENNGLAIRCFLKDGRVVYTADKYARLSLTNGTQRTKEYEWELELNYNELLDVLLFKHIVSSLIGFALSWRNKK